MAKISESQEVKQFHDDEMIVEQKVYIDTTGPNDWIYVTHFGDQLSMSLGNWNKLVELVNKAKSKITDAV